MAKTAKGDLVKQIRDSSDGHRKVLDQTALQAAYAVAKEIRTQTRTDVEDSRRMPGIATSTEDPNKKALWLPSTLKVDVNEIGTFFATAALQAGLDVVYYKRDDLTVNLTREQELIADGLILSLGESFVNVTSKGIGIERGRKMGFAIRVRSLFQSDPLLGASALVQNNRWFGNVPPTRGKENVREDSFFIKDYFRSLNRDKPEFCEILGRLAIHLLSMLTVFPDPNVPVSQQEEARKKIVTHYLRPIAEIEARHKREFETEILVRNKLQKKKEVRGPRKPNPSSLLCRGEMSIINTHISPYWRTLEPLHKEWAEEVLKNGFPFCEKRIAESMQVRWKVLEGLSAMTTSRLNKIRDIFKDDGKKLRKANIEGLHLLEYYKSLDDPVGDFCRALKKLLPDSGLIPDWMKDDYDLYTSETAFACKDQVRSMYRTETIIGQKIEFTAGALDKTVSTVPTLAQGLATLTMSTTPAQPAPGARTLRAQKPADGKSP